MTKSLVNHKTITQNVVPYCNPVSKAIGMNINTVGITK